MAIRLYATEDTENLPITVSDGNPYYVGARAYVEQLSGSAKITVIDKEGTTIATVYDGDKGDKGDTGDKGDKGDTGDTGNGIASVTLNDDYTLTILFTDGTSVTTDSIRGEQGEKGDKGDKGDTGEVSLAQLQASMVKETVSGDPASFSDGADNFPAIYVKADLEPIQSGSGTPSPTNIRPISGHDSVDTNKTGINVWDEEWQNGYLGNSGSVISDANSVCSKNYIPIKQSATYYAVCPSGKSLRICAYKEDETFISLQSVANRTFTLPSGTAYIKWSCYGYGTTYNNDISINYPSTDTEYHAYQGTTYTTALGRTVYGGNLEQISGLLTDNMAIYQIGANTNFSAVQTSQAAGNWVEVLSVTNARTADTEVLTVSECCKSVSNNNRAVDVNDYRCYAANGHLYLRAPAGANVTTKEDFHSIFDGYNIVYELATPQTYQLTAQQINTLLGVNNLWASSGEVEVKYCADTALYIAGLNA